MIITSIEIIEKKLMALLKGCLKTRFVKVIQTALKSLFNNYFTVNF